MQKRGQAPVSHNPILDGTMPVKYPFRDNEPVRKSVKWPFLKGKNLSQEEIRVGLITRSEFLL
jgi:hypothetical protein